MALVVGGLVLAAAVSMKLPSRLARYVGPVDGDVLRGPVIVIGLGLITALLAAIGFLLLRIGQRWGSWFSALIWPVAWFPAGLNMGAYIGDPKAGFAVTTTFCLLAVLLAAATFLLMPPSPDGTDAPD
ncbi:hypothetical protein ACFVTE_16910 [Arthrobacter sp. NPDC058097]|uniref:hypothetical protein n=1 Tax=Arthrobacter sp. NPDC058097 TaxID=3346340 RepID=UPI0036DCB9CE